MEPVSLSVKHEPNVYEWRVLLALGHIRPTRVVKLLTVCARIWLMAGQDPLIWSPGAGTTDWHLIKSRMDPSKTSYEWQHECKVDKRFTTEEIVVSCTIWTLRSGICTASAMWKLSCDKGEINILEAVGWGGRDQDGQKLFNWWAAANLRSFSSTELLHICKTQTDIERDG